jgi:hypothetical protein
MRSLSAAALRAVFHSETTAIYCDLITISDGSSTIYLTNNNVNLIYEGNTYSAFPFRVDQPDETDDAVANAKLTICNADRTLVSLIRGLTSRPAVTLVSAFYYENGTYEKVPQYEFLLSDITYNKGTITANLIYDDRLSINVPALHFSPFYFPGVAAAL